MRNLVLHNAVRVSGGGAQGDGAHARLANGRWRPLFGVSQLLVCVLYHRFDVFNADANRRAIILAAVANFSSVLPTVYRQYLAARRVDTLY